MTFSLNATCKVHIAFHEIDIPRQKFSYFKASRLRRSDAPFATRMGADISMWNKP